MRKIIVTLIGLNLLGFCLNLEARDFEKPNEELRSQIVLYNFLAGLSLTPEQTEIIINEANRVASYRRKMQEKIKTQSQEELDSLIALREEVKKEAPQVNDDLAKKVHEGNFSLVKMHKEYRDIINEAVETVKLQLTDKQIYVFESFKPCLVPPKGEGRVGQDTGSGNLTKAFERIRSIPERRYEANKNKIVARVTEKISTAHPKLTEEKLDQIQQKFIQIVKELRVLSDAEFSVMKEVKADELKASIDKDQNNDLDQRVAWFLLNPQIVTVLEDNL